MEKTIALALAAAAIFSGCSNSAKLVDGRSGSVDLAGFAPRLGGHCESSAMLNALAYLGYGVSEADIVGGGGAVSFLFTDDEFPFIGGRNDRMREIFLESAQIPCGAAIPAKGSGGWKDIFALLDRRLPVLLRVDMRWLPYLYGGKYGSKYMSFGGHWVCLAGIDFDAGAAFVTDTDRAGLQRVALSDLDKARFSDTRTFPPRGEYAWIESKPASWRLDSDTLARRAFGEILANYGSAPAAGMPGFGFGKGPLVGIAGLAAFTDRLASIHSKLNPYALPAAYGYMAGSIERNGTGGAAFRRFFRDFARARAVDCADPGLRAACAGLVTPTEASMAAWSSLAASFDGAAAAIGAARTPAEKKTALAAAEAETADRARAVLSAESALREAIAAVDVASR